MFFPYILSYSETPGVLVALLPYDCEMIKKYSGSIEYKLENAEQQVYGIP